MSDKFAGDTQGFVRCEHKCVIFNKELECERRAGHHGPHWLWRPGISTDDARELWWNDNSSVIIFVDTDIIQKDWMAELGLRHK